MWVYQQTEANKTLALPPAPAARQPRQSAAGDSAPQAAAPFRKTEAAPLRRAVPQEKPRRHRGLSRECAALAASYLFGALLAGVMLALGREGERAWLAAYLANWTGLFTLDGPGAVWTLFGAEYLTAAAGATVLLLLGLSAAGPVLIYLFAMLFGLGVGAASLGLFLSAGWRQALFGLCFSGMPTAAAAAALCLFGASALAVSARLQQAAFGRQELPALAGARGLLAQYLALNVLFLPLCGLSTALACLAAQLGRL